MRSGNRTEKKGIVKALLIIGMQTELQDRIKKGQDHVNSEAAARIAELCDLFRDNGLPVIHIRHSDDDPASPLHCDALGYQPMPCAEELDDEPVFVKKTSSAFTATDLASHLRAKGITNLVVTGAVAGICINSTVRQGANLGFDMTVVRDAVLGFDLPTGNLSAREIFDATMAYLEPDFAAVVDTSSVRID